MLFPYISLFISIGTLPCYFRTQSLSLLIIFHKLFTNRSFVLYLYIIYGPDTLFDIFSIYRAIKHHERSRIPTNISNRVKLVFTSKKHLTIDYMVYIVQYLLSIIVNTIYITVVLFENII